jgi:phage pi2 protein 07
MKTEKDEFFTRNSELSIEFSKYVLEHPEMDDLLTEETAVVFLPEFDAELKDFNLRMAKEIESEGGKVLYVKVKEIAPKIASRLIGVEVGEHSDIL